MEKKRQYVIDEPAERAGGCFAHPSAENIAHTDLLFDVCRQFGIQLRRGGSLRKCLASPG